MHHGSINQGHYYCFIKPRLEESENKQLPNKIGTQWYKFNDMTVTKALTHTALSTGQGGFHSYFYKEKVNDGTAYKQSESELNDNLEEDIELDELFERKTAVSTQAYMLVYIREREQE